MLESIKSSKPIKKLEIYVREDPKKIHELEKLMVLLMRKKLPQLMQMGLKTLGWLKIGH